MRGKTVIVTGGGSGIGRAAVLLCAEQGASVGILDIDYESAITVAEEARHLGASDAIGVRCDVRMDAEVWEAFAKVEERLGPVYGLFANAGIGTGGGMLHELDYDTWERIINTNLTGIYLACKYAFRSMVASGQGGSIVCTSSPTSFVAEAPGGVPPSPSPKGMFASLLPCLTTH